MPACAPVAPALRAALLAARAGTGRNDAARSAGGAGRHARRRWPRWMPTAKCSRRRSCTSRPGCASACKPRIAREFPAVGDAAGRPAGGRAGLGAARRSARRRAAAEGLRRLLLAIVRDLRVVFILLARQLARMRAAATLPPAQRRALAQLTARHPRAAGQPARHLAAQVGAGGPRVPLPAARHLPAHRAPARRASAAIASVSSRTSMATLRERAARRRHARRRRRPAEAHLFSIWKKMQRKDVPIRPSSTTCARVRVLVDDIAACYAALGVVHALWPPMPSEFDDYIARPKGNDYQSLHTAVIGPEGKTLEVQIRTHEMHAHAELGVAAHWRYKEGGRHAPRRPMPRSSARSPGCASCSNRKAADARRQRRPARRAAHRTGRGSHLPAHAARAR